MQRSLISGKSRRRLAAAFLAEVAESLLVRHLPAFRAASDVHRVGVCGCLSGDTQCLTYTTHGETLALRRSRLTHRSPRTSMSLRHHRSMRQIRLISPISDMPALFAPSSTKQELVLYWRARRLRSKRARLECLWYIGQVPLGLRPVARLSIKHASPAV